MMASPRISHPLRAVAGAALLTLAGLAAPAASQAQSGRAAGAIPRDPPASSAVDGQRALLNTGPAGDPAVFSPVREAPASVDGEAALQDTGPAAGEAAMSSSVREAAAPVDGAIALLQSGVAAPAN